MSYLGQSTISGLLSEDLLSTSTECPWSQKKNGKTVFTALEQQWICYVLFALLSIYSFQQTAAKND